MTLEDSKIILGNITELAIFSDMFCDCLEEALGSVLEGGEGEDCVAGAFPLHSLSFTLCQLF